jgi:Ankyrin repeats (3 copies)/Ankyrin repeat
VALASDYRSGLEGRSVRQVTLFAAFAVSVGWVAPRPGHAQAASPSRDSLLWAACMPVYIEEFKQKGSDDQRAPVMASMICQIVTGTCPQDLRGERCDKSIRLLSDKVEKSGMSLPYMAASAGRTDVIKRLIELKVDVNKPIKASLDSTSGRGWTPLMIAAAEGHAETVSALVEAGANVNATNALGRTALTFASSYGLAAIVKVLLDHHADPNIIPKDSTGWTAVIAAAHNGHLEVVRLLLDHGADVSIQDKQGRTALAWAQAQGHADVALALREAAAKK